MKIFCQFLAAMTIGSTSLAAGLVVNVGSSEPGPNVKSVRFSAYGLTLSKTQRKTSSFSREVTYIDSVTLSRTTRESRLDLNCSENDPQISLSINRDLNETDGGWLYKNLNFKFSSNYFGKTLCENIDRELSKYLSLTQRDQDNMYHRNSFNTAILSDTERSYVAPAMRVSFYYDADTNNVLGISIYTDQAGI